MLPICRDFRPLASKLDKASLGPRDAMSIRCIRYNELCPSRPPSPRPRLRHLPRLPTLTQTNNVRMCTYLHPSIGSPTIRSSGMTPISDTVSQIDSRLPIFTTTRIRCPPPHVALAGQQIARLLLEVEQPIRDIQQLLAQRGQLQASASLALAPAAARFSHLAVFDLDGALSPPSSCSINGPLVSARAMYEASPHPRLSSSTHA